MDHICKQFEENGITKTKYRYTDEQRDVLCKAMLKAYKEINDSGLFPCGVPSYAHTISWAMMAMLQPGYRPRNKADRLALDAIDFMWTTM